MSVRMTPAGAAARVALVAVACALTFVGVVRDGRLASTALMTDSAGTGPAAVSTGGVALSLSNGASSGSWSGAVTLKPGDTAYQRLTVTNSGASRLRYAVTATSVSALSANLTMTVASIASGSSCTSTTYSAGTVISGSDLAFGAASALNVIGDPASGADDGDRVLEAATSDNLCLKLTFPTGTGLGYAGRGSTASTTFAFTGENA